jgi:hypothetical protein
MKRKLALLVGLLLGATAFAADPVPFAAALPPQTHCEVAIALLRPTQFSVGQKEVEMRAAKLRKLTAGALAEYLDKHIAPIVVGPGGEPYLLDHHHLARAILLAGIPAKMPAEVKENWSQLSEPEFWAKMKAAHWLYLYDETGKGPLEPVALPRTIGKMRDDPYRSLVWLVRKRGGLDKSSEPFSEFVWANFFRTRVKFTGAELGSEPTIQSALALAHSPEAKDLPGYVASADKAGH